jgi:hypothetical protein
MFFLNKFRGLAGIYERFYARPVAQTAVLMSPLQAPNTLKKIPEAFAAYSYAETHLATFKGHDPQTGTVLRQRALIARMVLVTHGRDDEHAVAEIDCFVTAQDLRHAKHPQADAIIKLLSEQMSTYVTPESKTHLAQGANKQKQFSIVRAQRMSDA